jgi:hypothetical protein
VENLSLELGPNTKTAFLLETGHRGLYMGKYPFPQGEGEYRCHLGGKNMTRGKEKEGKCKRKRKQ